MFGIGFGELLIIALVVLIAVGPDKMPTFMKAVGRGLREFRRATRELRNSVGLDELLRDEDLKELRKPIQVPSGKGPAKPAPRKITYDLTDADLDAEYPPEGSDLAHLEAHPPAEVDATAGAAPGEGPVPASPGAGGKGAG